VLHGAGYHLFSKDLLGRVNGINMELQNEYFVLHGHAVVRTWSGTPSVLKELLRRGIVTWRCKPIIFKVLFKHGSSIWCIISIIFQSSGVLVLHSRSCILKILF